jgi:thiamine biosynthesis lipoprotein
MTLSRRRFISISAAALAMPASASAIASPVQEYIWQGTALGAKASIRLAGPDGRALQRHAESLQGEISRLEDVFSLYRHESSVSRLNRDGRLMAPPPEMLELMSLISTVHKHSSGAFDPTVQSLWRVHADARKAGRDTTGAEIEKGRQLTGWRNVRYSEAMIEFRRPGIQLTFNGIAQGYVADRVAEFLRREGFTDVLIDLGEIRALGSRATGEPWRIGIADPDGKITRNIGLSDRALATSSPAGGRPTEVFHKDHIIDPRTGVPGRAWHLVSVSGERAVVADALSTAICLLDRESAYELIAIFPCARLEHLS